MAAGGLWTKERDESSPVRPTIRFGRDPESTEADRDMMYAELGMS